MENSKSILERAFEVNSAGGDGIEVLEELVRQELAPVLNALANRHPEDLPLVVAVVKSSLPHWERALGETGRELCRIIQSSMMTVDVGQIQNLGNENK